ncbi:MAG: hypothetical protein U1E65_31045 [Myxococcota bacterium]
MGTSLALVLLVVRPCQDPAPPPPSLEEQLYAVHRHFIMNCAALPAVGGPPGQAQGVSFHADWDETCQAEFRELRALWRATHPRKP